MRKFISFFVLFGIISTLTLPMVSARITLWSGTPTQAQTSIVYPGWADFMKLKSLIDTNFSPSEGNNYRSNCIANRTLCTNYKYTSIIEKAIKLIIVKTYTGNETFYETLFWNNGWYNYSNPTIKKTVKNILDNIPRGSSLSDWKSLGFGNSIGGELLDASFWVNFTENANSNTMMGSLENKIKEMKRKKCQNESRNNRSMSNDCYSNDISNIYLPTQDELYNETIYLNRGSVKIGSLKDEIEYKISWNTSTFTEMVANFPNKNNVTIFTDNVLLEKTLEQSVTSKDLSIKSNVVISYLEEVKNVRVSPTLFNIGSTLLILERESTKSGITTNEQTLISWLKNEMEYYKKELQKIAETMSYILRYKKENFTLEEAKIELEEKETSNEEFLVTMNDEKGQIPCKKYTVHPLQSDCAAATASLTQVKMWLDNYYIDNNALPDSLDKIKPYLSKLPQWFTDNFSYKPTKNSRGEADYEIRYIGHIGENTTGSWETEWKKDYKVMMSGATVPEIPAIFANIPADSMVLYVKNPENLIDLMNQKWNTSQRLSWIDVSESIRNFMKTFFELEKFEQIEKHLKHEMAIVVNNLDATAPDVVIIISSLDKEALSPTGKARVVGSKSGYIFIASSKESLEKLTNLTVEKSLKNAPDFHYVWWKKSALVKDALMFVGDEFFEKMLTLETYLTHYRKYRDYARLTSLQELTWAYGDAFGKSPTGFAELSRFGFSTLTGEALSEYSILDGLVSHKNIGTLKSIKTLPEVRYDLSKISRTELDDYKYNVLQYRDIWRASLDPMGIVINRYGDGMEIDFFMTPIPTMPNRDLQEIQKIFEWTTKDSLSFITNPQIRMGLASFVWWFDVQKFQTKIKSNQEIWEEFEKFSKEILDGKNIFDYIAWEFAFSIGNLDPDIFEGWNVEKVDAYVSVQVASEEKWKELIEMLKKKFIGEVNRGGSSAESSMFSMLTKPLIEDYGWKKIYYVEAIPVPWVGEIGIAYTFVDNFFMIGLNRSTIRHIIDTAKSGDNHKKNLVSQENFEKGTFFAMLFDGVNSSIEIKKLYEKNQSMVPRFFGSMIQSESTITPLISSYYATEDRSRRLKKKSVSFHHELGSLSLSGTGDTLMVKMNPSKFTSLSGSILEMWETIKKDPIFPTALLTEQGVPLEVFLAYPKVWDILSINMIVQLDAALGGSESLLRNATFGLSLGDDEIGFRFRVWREIDGAEWWSQMMVPNAWIIAGIVALFIILGGLGWFVLRPKVPGVPAP